MTNPPPPPHVISIWHHQQEQQPCNGRWLGWDRDFPMASPWIPRSPPIYNILNCFRVKNNYIIIIILVWLWPTTARGDKSRTSLVLYSNWRRRRTAMLGDFAGRRRELICEFARTLPLITTCKSLLRTIIGWEWHWPWTIGRIHSPALCAWYTLSWCCCTTGQAVEAATRTAETRTSLFGHYLFWSSFATMSKMLSIENNEGSRVICSVHPHIHGQQTGERWRCQRRPTDLAWIGNWFSPPSDQWTELEMEMRSWFLLQNIRVFWATFWFDDQIQRLLR